MSDPGEVFHASSSELAMTHLWAAPEGTAADCPTCGVEGVMAPAAFVQLVDSLIRLRLVSPPRNGKLHLTELGKVVLAATSDPPCKK